MCALVRTAVSGSWMDISAAELLMRHERQSLASSVSTVDVKNCWIEARPSEEDTRVPRPRVIHSSRY